MAIAFLDLAASIPTKASVYSTMASPPCAEDRLGPPEQPSSRIVGRATSSAAGRAYGHIVGGYGEGRVDRAYHLVYDPASMRSAASWSRTATRTRTPTPTTWRPTAGPRS